MRLIVARHCQTAWNVAGLIQGQTDIPLNEHGQEQAAVLALKLPRPGAIVCSDLARSVETAEIVARFHPVPIRRDPRLRECSFGRLEGLTRQGAIRQFGGLVAARLGDDYDLRPFGGECADDVLGRHLAAIKELADAPLTPPLLIGHSRGLRTLLRHFKLEDVPPRGDFLILDV